MIIPVQYYCQHWLAEVLLGLKQGSSPAQLGDARNWLSAYETSAASSASNSPSQIGRLWEVAKWKKDIIFWYLSRPVQGFRWTGRRQKGVFWGGGRAGGDQESGQMGEQKLGLRSGSYAGSISWAARSSLVCSDSRVGLSLSKHIGDEVAIPVGKGLPSPW